MKNKILEIIDLVKSRGELSYIEVKDSLLDVKKISETMSAIYNSALYLNKNECYIIWGLSDGNWEYTNTSFDINKDGILNQIIKSFNIKPEIITEEIFIKDKRIFVLKILTIQGQILSASNVAYIRIDSHNSKLLDYPGHLKKISSYVFDWTSEYAESSSLAGLDEQAITLLKKKLSEIEKDAKWLSFDNETLLKKLYLCNEKLELNRTALLFLCKYDYVIKFLNPDICYITWKYKDQEHSIEERTPEPLTVPFLITVYRAEDFINRFNTTLKDLDLFRPDIRQYDHSAIEELLINSFAHRDWSINLWNEIIQTAQALEIRNPGKFNADLDQVLNENNVPDYKNPSMCNFLKKLKLMEREREGLQKVYLAQYQKGLRIENNFHSDPQRTDFILRGVVTNEDFARLVLRNTEITLRQLLILDKIASGKNLLGKDISQTDFEEIKSYIIKHHKSDAIRINTELLRNLKTFDKEFISSHTSSKTKEEVFLDFAKQNGEITTKNAYKLFPQESKNTIRQIIKRLKDSGKIKMITKGMYTKASIVTVISGVTENPTEKVDKILTNKEK